MFEGKSLPRELCAWFVLSLKEVEQLDKERY